MKTQLISLISKVTLLSAMLLVNLTASAQGQSLSHRVKANIPFDFTVGEKQLPAGEYSVARTIPSSGDLVMSITDHDRSHQSDSTDERNCYGEPKGQIRFGFPPLW